MVPMRGYHISFQVKYFHLIAGFHHRINGGYNTAKNQKSPVRVIIDIGFPTRGLFTRKSCYDLCIEEGNRVYATF